MKRKITKTAGLACLMLAVTVTFGSVSHAADTGGIRKRGSCYEEKERWDYTDVIGDDTKMAAFGNSRDGYLENQVHKNARTKLTVSTGEGKRAELTSSADTYIFADGTSGNAAVFRADAEHPWEAGANISLDLKKSVDAFFLYFTAEIGFSGNAPRVWKLQYSCDNGKSYTDVENGLVEVQEEGHTQMLFHRVSIPDPPYHYVPDYLEHPDAYDKIPYRLRLSAVSENDGTDDWEGSREGEVCVKQIGLGQWCITLDDPDPVSENLLADGTVSSAKVQKGECLSYGFTLRNIGIKSPLIDDAEILRITWASEGKQTIEQDLPCHGYGAYNGKIQISDGMQSGKWKISRIQFLTDQYVRLKPRNTEVLTFTEKTTGVFVDFSFSAFHVQGTTADRKAPVIRKKSMGLTKKSLTGNGKTKFYLKAGDKSPVRYVICGWKNAKTKKTVYYNMKYSKRKQRYECTISDKGLEKRGDYRLALVQACDRYGNRTTVKGGLAGFKIARK